MNVSMPDPLTIVLVIAGIVLVWLLLRFLLKLAVKVFACGCAVIAVIGAALVLLALAANR